MVAAATGLIGVGELPAGAPAAGDAADGAISTAVEIETPGAIGVLATGRPAPGDAPMGGWAVTDGVSARGASTSVVLV